ncbi:C69 family dipeptidase [Metabacillus hrfriensis]|uniref:C69 family dipeptidase n=1 Tax=Metabacillus hrfriensis TaxID=3048891 RepID=A0ACD4RD61_9BACI|nr:C69 family dipeptidase [Metabacillus sp. CT-WN-B3]WHZ58105.1 C69 family dipeptidase [Metabacillus sp. CT-WN-B3]
MCDNLVVLPDSTSQTRMLVAKNSDRPAYESQPLVYNKRQTYENGKNVKLAYLNIPQIKETYLTIGSSPFWCWGYEQGINEHGVAIGNEAIFTKDLKDSAANPEKQKGILGMELVRLGLERGKTAKEALEVITKLIEKYGQWGSAVVGEEKPYNNSFIIADSKEAWVLETVDHHWAAKKIQKKCHSISNEMSIRNDWDLNSEGFMERAIRSGWADRAEDFDAAHAYTDFTNALQVSHIRVQRTKQLLHKKAGEIDVPWLKRILRDHYEDTFLEGPFFNAALPDFQTICMHSSPANFTWGITASSTVFELPADEWHFPVIWWSPATPCTGLYLPLFMCEQEFPVILSQSGTVRVKTADPTKSEQDQSAKDSYWWMFRDLLDELKGDENGILFTKNKEIFRKTFDVLEQKWLRLIRDIEEEAAVLNKAGKQKEAIALVTSFSNECLKEALEAIEKIRTQIKTAVLS